MLKLLLHIIRLFLAAAFAVVLFTVPLIVGYALAKPDSSRVVWVVSAGHGLHESEIGLVGFGVIWWAIALLLFAITVRWRP